MSTWNFRIIRHIVAGEEHLSIHEVYYDDDGKPDAYTLSPRAVDYANNVEDIRWTLAMMLEATDKPILNAEDFE